MRFPLVPVLTLALLLLARPAVAQDFQYGTNQYGPRSTMLGGATIAGSHDSSAIVYNPAGLGFNEGGGISINANAWRLGHIQLDDAAGQGADLSTVPISQVPLLLAGVLRIDEWPETRLAWAVMARSLFDFSVSTRIQQTVDVIATEAGSEAYTGQYDYSTSLNEIQLAGTFAQRLTRELSVGVTVFGALRTQSSSESITVGAIAVSSNVSSVFDSRSVDLLHVRLFAKLGVEWHPADNWEFGAALTLPALGLIGSGSLARDISVTNVDLDTNGATEDAFGSALQDGLGARWRSPLSLSIGGTWQAIPEVKVAVAAELFLPISRYTTIAPDSGTFEQSATGLLPGLDEALRSSAAARTVFNLHVGGEFTIQPYRPDTDEAGGQTGFVARVGFRTDFSNQRDNPTSTYEQGVASWDLFHLTVGLGVENRQNEITVGLEFTLAGGEYRQHVTFDNPSEANFLLGTPGRTGVGYLIVGIIIGYSHKF